MKNPIYSLYTGLLSIILSIVAICIAAYRTPELTFDYQGVIVGALSLLVTVLIGWQIFNTLNFKKDIQDVKDAKNTIIYNSELNAIQTYMSLSEYYGKEIGIRPMNEHGYRYIYFNLSVILHASIIGEYTTCNTYVKVLLETVTEEVKLRKADKDNIFKLISMISNTQRIENFPDLLNRISRLKECH